jgi:flagellin
MPDLSEQIQSLSKIDLSSNAQNAIKTINNMQLSISSAQSTMGSVQNNLDEQTNNLMVSYENTVASQSKIVDADMAKEMLLQTTDKIKSTSSLYSVIDFKNTTLEYMESLLSG